MVLTKLPWSAFTSASNSAELVKALQRMFTVKRALPPKIGPVVTMGIPNLQVNKAPLWNALCRVFGCRAVVSKRQDKTNIVFVGSSEDITLAALACRKTAKKLGDDPHEAEVMHMHIRHAFSAVPEYLTTTEAIRSRIKAMGKVSGFVKPVWR